MTTFNTPHFRRVIFGEGGPIVTSNWILATGFWVDTGIWIDADVWVD